uniref:Uncharacterized protein n=1 Tax=Arundo donax TaxID=35708 RepID=A0A0A9GU93_ARUDO
MLAMPLLQIQHRRHCYRCGNFLLLQFSFSCLPCNKKTGTIQKNNTLLAHSCQRAYKLQP